MGSLQSVVEFILNLGAAVFVPALMIIIGLIVRMKVKDAVSAGIILGVAFLGMNIVIGFMIEALTPAAQGLAERTGIELTILDGGWTSMATLAWAWPLAFLMFPLQLGINAIMLAFNATKTLNVDLWNVWGKILTAVLIVGVTHNVYLAFAVAAVQVVTELILCDANQRQIQELNGIPGVTVSHSMMIFCVVLMPIDWLLKKIPALRKNMDANALKDKIGIFAENHVMGFIVGALLGIAAGYDIAKTLMLAMQAAAALTLFPMVAKLFMQALSPLSDGISDYMKRRFKDRELFIGLDWPILAGCSEVWVAIVIMVPVTLIFALILPGNGVLPFAGILNISLCAPALVVTGGNLLRMIILGVVTTPVFLYVATFFAGTITDLANSTKAISLQPGQEITWSTLEYPVFRYIMAEASKFSIIGLLMLAGWLVLLVFYVKVMRKRTAELEQLG
ncbi:PTS system galactitol-specific, IIC component [Listeria weihenstephanensis FSL R9-0317]|uniref:PTS galactitol transporter subunit IIC n=1 Tax=Listeria weihenstephanensis TaxID=1006155 RepID=A0A1S7FWP0_9LIST|nr:PTS transporter subunit IIC [Listeria weihenstephanensis]AQY51757.1 PTS galactitol transporter subunit IIC [Listeria weihenstephanensis]EUJ41223.1 PTS system galactitol-specific, IIC component [Listeria weihenstephanensis FSL R9-0317]MBC1501768.1 PTS galactitol transporter subunit IIC [Listeria weihenstephanensis]